MSKLHLEVITPQRIVLEADVDAVVVPAVEGEITVLPDHIPLFTRILPGEIKYIDGKSEHFMAVQEGFLEVQGGGVKILTNFAVRSEEVEVAKAEAAKKRAEEMLREKKGQADMAIAEGELRKAILQLKVARRRPGRPS